MASLENYQNYVITVSAKDIPEVQSALRLLQTITEEVQNVDGGRLYDLISDVQDEYGASTEVLADLRALLRVFNHITEAKAGGWPKEQE
jgi:hypothetical protein